mgnify:CR=1 FL=1
MKIKFLSSVLVSILLLALQGFVYSQQLEATTTVTGGISTLYANDPLGQSLCFKDGKYGSVFEGGQVRNRCSHLNFNSYSKNGFRAGVQGGEKGIILDLGSPQELQEKYKYGETVGFGQGFAALGIKNGKAFILKDHQAKTVQAVEGSEVLYQDSGDLIESAPVNLGHVYLVRVFDPQVKNTDILAKVIVISYIPDQFVTFRWQLLVDEKTIEK